MTTPGSRPRSTARVTAADPNRSRTSSSAASIASNRDRTRARAGATRSSSRFMSAIPTVRPCASIVGVDAARSPRAASRIGAIARNMGERCDRVARVKSAKRRRSTTVRQTRSPFAAGGRRGRRGRRRSCRSRRAISGDQPRRAGRSSRAAFTVRTARRVAGCGRARGDAAGRPAEEVDEHRLVQPRDLADGVDPAWWSLSAVTRPGALALDGEPGGGRSARRPRARRGGRPAWRRRSRPWRGTCPRDTDRDREYDLVAG